MASASSIWVRAGLGSLLQLRGDGFAAHRLAVGAVKVQGFLRHEVNDPLKRLARADRVLHQDGFGRPACPESPGRPAAHWLRRDPSC